MPNRERLDPAMSFIALGDTAADPQPGHIVHEQAARDAASMAIARWSSAGADRQGEGERAAALSVQAHWYAHARGNFQQWLASGGFRQPELPASEHGITNSAWLDAGTESPTPA